MRFSLKQWLQAAAVGWGAAEGDVWKDDSFYGRRPHGNGPLCVSEPLTWTVTAGEPSSHPTLVLSLSPSIFPPSLLSVSLRHQRFCSAEVSVRPIQEAGYRQNEGIGVVFWVHQWIWGGSAFCTELENSSCVSQCSFVCARFGSVPHCVYYPERSLLGMCAKTNFHNA